jgi:hypothetical protein
LTCIKLNPARYVKVCANFPEVIEIMVKNVGTVDKVIRIVLGIVLIGLIFVLQVPIKWGGLIMAVVGVVLIITALMNFCPIFRIFGMSSRKGTSSQ